MNEIQIFNNPEFGDVRTLMVEDEPWFVGMDVATALGYKDTVNAIKQHVDDIDKQNLKGGDSPCLNIPNRGMTFINESGLYALIFGSKLPNAKQFKRWVTSEVLPAIRKHGMWATDEILNNPDFLIATVQRLKDEREKRLEAERTIEAQKPKVLFAEAVETSKSSILIGELAKIISQNGCAIGQNRLFGWLRDHGYLAKSGERKNMPNQRYIEQGLFEIKKSTVQNPNGSIRVTSTTKVTGKGQQYFINAFLRNGVQQ